MCLDAQTSIITLVIGTVFNIWNVLHYKDPSITAVSILWQWVLLMQAWEALTWLNQPEKGEKCNPMNTFAAKGAYLSNVTQPIVLALVVFAINSESITDQGKIAAAVIIFMYILWLLYAANKAPEVECLKPGKDCRNLTYTWWKDFPLGASVYMASLFFLIIILIKPLKFALMQLAYIIITFIVSAYFYSCGIGSVWCLLAAFAPILVGPMWEASKT